MRRTPERIVLATANPHKAAELRAALTAAGLAVEVLDRPGDLPPVHETADTLERNAAAKAHAVADATGLAALADDTGLEVDALGGAPGVHAARYAGPAATDAENVAKLLAALEGTEAEGRTARFVTVLVLAEPVGADGTRPSDLVVRGAVAGRIAPAPRGRYGFGYDPVFVPDGGGGRTFGEMGPDEKAGLSHRSRAIAALVAAMRDAERHEPRGG